MYIDISTLTNKITSDSFASFLSSTAIDVTGFGRWQQTDVQKLDNFIIPDYELVFIATGRSRIAVNGDSRICSRGTAVLFEPFLPCSAECLPGGRVEYYYIHFDIRPAYMEERFHQLVFGHEHFFKQDPFFTLRSLERVLDDYTKGREGAYTLLQTCLYQFFVFAMRETAAAADADTPALPWQGREIDIVHATMDYFAANISQPIKIADAARYVGVSESALYKAFVSVMEMPPVKYLLRYKIKQAERLLKTTTLPMQEIAGMLGFSSMFHFSKTFKAWMGMPPSEYRERNSKSS